MKQEPSAFELKDQGNKYFSIHKYDEAIQCYNKAIVCFILIYSVYSIKSNHIIQVRNPSVPTFFTNRALSYLRLQRWDLACQDCRRALDMDPNLIKGHFFLGQALIELEQYDEAIKHLLRGMITVIW